MIVRAGLAADREHPSVDVRGHARHHEPRWRPEAGRPRLPDQVVVAADAAARDDHGLRAELEPALLVAVRRPPAVGAVRCQHGPAYAGHLARAARRAGRDDQRVDPVPEREAQPPGGRVLTHPSREGLHHTWTGAPGQVEARHRVAVPVRASVSALGPPDHGEEPQPHPPQPCALLAGGEGDVRLGPPLRPVILDAIELGAAHPVGQRQVEAVRDAHPSLLRGVDEEQPAQAPERLAAQRLLALLVDDDHAPAGVRDLRGGGEAGQTVTYDDDIGVHDWSLRLEPALVGGSDRGQ